MRFTRKGYGKLLRHDGTLVSQHTVAEEAYESAARTGEGSYTWQPAPIAIVVEPHDCEVPAPAPAPAPVPAPAPEPAPAPVPAPAPEPAPEPAPAPAPEPAPTPEPAPAPEPPTPYVPPDVDGMPPQYRTWDGITGTGLKYWNLGAKLAWKNADVGDWRDANGVEQGDTPFASAHWAEPGSQSLDVTALVDRQITDANRGFFLKASGTQFSISFGGSRSAQAPSLRIVTTEGSFNAPCLATAYWSIGSYKNFSGQESFKVQKDGHHAIVQFDYSGITGDVLSATLTLTTSEWSRATTILVFEADPPEYLFAENPAPGGIAQGYQKDTGIESHPAVLFASDFHDLGAWDRRSGLENSALVTDEAGITALRCRTPGGTHSGVALTKYLMRGTAAGGPPDRVVEEAYFRYYLTLEDDWRSEVDANKAPGFDCRMGYWNSASGGYWQSTGGNGGEPNDGRHEILPDGKHAYNGHMIRGHSGSYPADGNPYSDLIWLGLYNYNIDQTDFFGDAHRWGRFVAVRGEKVCIEQRIRMNSLVGPEDALGNREAAHDGIYQAWVNGELALNLTDVRWRRHPDLGIAAVGMTMYHGGTLPAPRDMHCRWGNVVIATEYIGPMRLDA